MSITSTDLLSQATGLPLEEVKNTERNGIDRIFEATGQRSEPGTTKPTMGGPVNPFDIASRVQNVSAIYTDPLESYREYGVPLNPFADLNEERAQRQTTYDKWVNGLTKAGITTLGAIYENTVGVLAGLGSLATGGEYYDNFVGKQVDAVNDWAQEKLPNYYTQEEINGSLLSNLGTANFWADKVANGLGYTLGSIATMWLGTGELGLASRIAGAGKALKAGDTALDIAGLAEKGARAANVVEDASTLGSRQLALYRAGKAIQTGEDLEKAARMARISTATQRLGVATQMSLAEASVEARETRTRFIEEQVAKWQEENPGQEVPTDVMNGIEESADAAGNAAFAINLPILATSNIIMFGKMFKGAAIGESQMYKATKDASGKLVEAGMDGKFAKAWTKSSRIFGGPVKNMATEGFQEGSQFAASEFSRDYYGDKFSDGIGDMSKSLSESLSKTLGSKEGLENILIGAIVGGGTGAVSRIAGADSKLAKARTANTAKVLQYINSGGLTKVIENMESNAYNTALVNIIEKNNKILESEEATPVQKAVAKQDAERARVQLIRSEAARMNAMGATDYMLEQLDDAASMSEDEFKKAFGYRMNSSLKTQTGKTQSELVQDVKNKVELSIKRSKQVQDILAKYQPKNTLLPKLLDSFQNEETKNNKELQRLVRNQYSQVLHAGLMDIDVIDEQIDDVYDHLVKIAPELGAISKEDFTYRVKIGQVNIDEEGKLSFAFKSTISPEAKLFEKFNEIFQAKYALNPADAEEFQTATWALQNLVKRREGIVTSFDNLRRNPENMDLYVEAEYARRQQEEKKASADRAAQVVQNAETADEVRENMPEDAPAEIIAAAESRVEELEQLEKEERAKFSSMTDDMLEAIDEESLPPIAAAALAKEKDARDKKRAAERTVEYQNGQLQRRDEFAPTASYTEYAQELSDAEAAALGNISVSSGGFIFTINGRTYLNLNETPTDAIIYDEEGNRIGVRLTDAATGNEVTWMLDDQNEEDSAIADTITYAILVQASSIRDVEAIANMSAEEFKEIQRVRGEVITEDVLKKHKKEVAAQEDTLKGKAKQFEVLDSVEDPDTIVEMEEELEKLVATTDIGKTAGLTDGQIRAQIEVIKQDLIEIDEILAAERQVAMEAGFTEAEFNADGNVKTLKAIKKSHKALLTKKIKELAKRKKASNIQENTDEEVVAEEIEQAPLEEEVDEITKGEESKISRLEDEIAQLKLVETELKKIADGTYPGQDVEAAKKEIRNTQNKIKRREESIRKSKELIQRINEERESEKLRQASNATEGTDIATEGQEPEATNIDSRAGSTEEGVDGTTTAEELEIIRQKREMMEQIDRTMDEPVDGPTDTQKDPEEPQVIAVVAEGPVDAPLAKGEIKSNSNFTEQTVTESGDPVSNMIEQKVGGETVSIYPEMLTDSDITPAGTVITFEVDESSDWWNSENPETRNNKKDLTEDRYWEQVPIYVVAQLPNGQSVRVGMLAAYKADENTGLSRQDIYNLYKQGITASSTISRKLFNSTNIANARTSNGQIFFYPSSNIVKGSPNIAVVRIKDAIPVFMDQNGNDLPFDTDNVALGQVAIIVKDPNGNPALVMASTKSMTEEGRTIAVNHLIKENPEAQLFGEIVGLNKLPVEVADENDAIDLNEGEDISTEDFKKYMSQVTLTDGKALFTFYSKSANKLVRINEEELKKALLGQPFKFTFSELGTNEKGWKSLVTIKGEKAEYARVTPNLKQEFLDIIMDKKYQVDINRINNTEPYISALTGIEYPSYFEYLNSDKEFTEPRTEGLGANVILSTDSPGNVNKSPFYDVGIEFTPLTGIGGGVTTQTQLEVSNAVKVLDSIEAPTSTQPSTQPTTTTTETADAQKIKSDNAQLGQSILQKLNYKNQNRLPNGNVKGGQAGWKIRFNIKSPTGGNYFNAERKTIENDKHYSEQAQKLVDWLNNYFGTKTKGSVSEAIKGSNHYGFTDEHPSSIWKFLSGGEYGESDFTIYIGSADDVLKFVEDVKASPIADLLVAGNQGSDISITPDGIFKARIEGADIGFSGYHVPSNLNKVIGSDTFTFIHNDKRVAITYKGSSLSDIMVFSEETQKAYKGVFDPNMQKDLPELYKNIRNIIGFQLYGKYLTGSNDEFVKLTGTTNTTTTDAKADIEMHLLILRITNAFEPKDNFKSPVDGWGIYTTQNGQPIKPEIYVEIKGNDYTKEELLDIEDPENPAVQETLNEIDRLQKLLDAELAALGKTATITPAVVAPSVSTAPTVSTPVAQSSLDVVVDELPADLFGAAPKTEQKSVPLMDPSNPFAHLKPNAEMQKALKAEMEAELRGLNPMGGAMQSFSDLMKEASQAGEKKKKEC